MQSIDDAWYFNRHELERQCGISYSIVIKGNQRGSKNWVCTKNPLDKRELLVRYDAMALKYQAIVRRVLCGGLEPGEFMARCKTEVLIKRSMSDVLEFACKDGYKRNIHLFDVENKHRIRSLARASAVIEAIGGYIREHELGWKKYPPFEEAGEWLEKNWSDFSEFKDVPANPIRLKEKVLECFVEGKSITDIVKLKNEGNTNREQFLHKFPQPLAWAMQLATVGQNYSDAYIIRKVTECCKYQDIASPSASWFSNLFAKPAVKRLRDSHRWEPGSRPAQRYSAYRPIEGAVNAGDAWMMDGTRVNFLPHIAPDGTTKYLYIVFVYDVYSGDVLGVDWCYDEDHIANINALKMAVSTTGYLPFELIFDKFPGHNTEQFGYRERGSALTGLAKQLHDYGVRLTCTIEATGKAAIERFIGTFQDVFLQESKYYYGQGVKSSRAAAHRTATYLTETAKEVKHEGWDFDQAWREANRWLQRYRSTVVSSYSKKNIDLSPRDRHDQSDKPLAICLRPEQVVQLFWLTKTLDIRREMVSMTVLKQDYFFPIADAYDILRHYNRVTVRYDVVDMSIIHLFDSKTDAYLCVLEAGSKVQRYGIDKPLADPERVKFVQAQQAIADRDQAELNGIRAMADDVVELTAKSQPKHLRELNEDRYQSERVPENFAARFQKAKPVPVLVSSESLDDIDLDAWARDGYKPNN